MDPMAAAQAEVRAAREREAAAQQAQQQPPANPSTRSACRAVGPGGTRASEARGQAAETLAIQASTSADVRGMAADRFS